MPELSQWISPAGEKRCTKCGEWSPFAEFPPQNNVRTGLSSWCRRCHREAVRAYRARRAAS